MTEYANNTKLNDPWMIAVWPGMGHVAISAGYYLMAKLGMHLLAEFSPRELFDAEHVEVKDGLVHMGRMPRSRLFVWNDPNNKHDIVVFIGEAQPPLGKFAFCRRLVEYAQRLGVQRVFTFAAMATQMRPEHRSRVFAAAADEQTLKELRDLDIQMLEDGQIGGLNGVLLGVAAESGLRGACLLGEMPQIFAQLPFPKASLAVLNAFSHISGVTVDTAELAEQSKNMEQQLGKILEQVQQAMQQQSEAAAETEEPDEGFGYGLDAEEPKLSAADEQRIEEYFKQAKGDRSKAYELKRELDRLEVFEDYEDRFLDLFKRPESN